MLGTIVDHLAEEVRGSTQHILQRTARRQWSAEDAHGGRVQLDREPHHEFSVPHRCRTSRGVSLHQLA